MPEDKSPKTTSKQTTSPASKPAEAPMVKPATKTSGLAIAALILVFIPGLTWIGLILGIVALVSIKKSGDKGKGLAIAAIILSIVFMLISVAAVWAVYFAANKAANDAGLNINTKDKTVTVNKDGESVSVGENAKLPDGFPSDVPIYEPSDVIASLSTGKDSYSASLVSNDSVTKISEYYTSELSKNGWQSSEDTASITLQSGSGSTYTKGDRTLLVIIASDKSSANKTSITLSVTMADMSQ